LEKASHKYFVRPRRLSSDGTSLKVESRDMGKLREAKATQAHTAPQIAEHVEQQLQASYSEVLHEPIPSRFLAVLDILEKQHGSDVQEKTPAPSQKKRARLVMSEAKI
jgi:hypothetical protein